VDRLPQESPSAKRNRELVVRVCFMRALLPSRLNQKSSSRYSKVHADYFYQVGKNNNTSDANCCSSSNSDRIRNSMRFSFVWLLLFGLIFHRPTTTSKERDKLCAHKLLSYPCWEEEQLISSEKRGFSSSRS
jgi:hypothetical protein